MRILFFSGAVFFMAAAAAAADLTFPADIASKISVLVLPFESRGSAADKGAMADDYLMEAFAELKRFTIVEREKFEKVLLEQKLSREKLAAPDHSVAIGRLLAADQMLSGRIEEVRGETVVTMNIVSTTTSISRDYSLSAEVAGMREFRRLIADMASKVAKDFPLLEGKIIRGAGNSYKAGIKGEGFRKGLEVIIYRIGDEVRHPTTGRMLGRRVIHVASGTIAAVEGGGISSIVLDKTEKGRKVKEGDLIITR